MTEDPLKLFVIVMAILLVVLGFVAYNLYDVAGQYEAAVRSAPGDAKRLREYASDILSLCKQLKQSKLDKGYLTLIERAARYHRIKLSSYKGQGEKTIPGGRGKEKRFKVEVTRGRNVSPLTREQIAKFCQTVERDSKGILKTIELTLRRVIGREAGKVGTEDKVTNDTYTFTIIFGLRVV